MFRLSAIVLATLVVLFGAPAQAFADWVIARTTGTVWLIAPDSTSYTPTAGQTFPDSWMLATGADGRIVLTRGTEVISLSPNTRMVLTDSGPNTRVIQPTGTIAYDVEHTGVPHFAVETPVLAAIVKGTQFTVTVQGEAADVSVSRGIVEVTGLASGQVTTIVAGQAAGLASANANLTVSGQGPLPPVYQGLPRAPLVGVTAAATPTTGITVTAAGMVVLGAIAGGAGDTTIITAAVAAGPVTAAVGLATGPGGTEFGVGAEVGGVEAGIGLGIGTGGTSGEWSGSGLEVEVGLSGLDINLGVGGGGIDLGIGTGGSRTGSGGGGGLLGGLFGG